MKEDVPEGNKDALTVAMSVIRDVRQENMQTGTLLESGYLNKQLNLLKKFGIVVDDIRVADKTVLEYLEASGVEWRTTIKLMHEKKEQIAPLQNAEMVSVKEELDEFFLKMRGFRGGFRKNAPFEYEVGPDAPAIKAYELLDKYNEEVGALSNEVQKFHELEDLFEIPHREYAEIDETLTEMQQLKYLLDNREMIDNIYQEWRSALWADIDTEAFDAVNKKIMKDLRNFTNNNGVVKAWTLYKDLETKVKDMSVLLPLINDLHSHAMRPRHWQSLAKISYTKFVCLAE